MAADYLLNFYVYGLHLKNICIYERVIGEVIDFLINYHRLWPFITVSCVRRVGCRLSYQDEAIVSGECPSCRKDRA